ncbi:hypothetical protein DdX_12840 [Ditylenchus destructor]|uniref:Uncharacterized protein n=1 Tax=Ditylenchus destructor TaxID=166010 RepID=A0AAD4QZZ2_9BILA|nr:hypothetical protein DdX_12840 [Ditylenchus destructor]
MVEAFKFLSYMQLAKNSLVSSRFRNVIRTHRHYLPLLYVDCIRMTEFDRHPLYVKIFDKVLSTQAYSEWVVRNQYSKQVPPESQIAGTLSTIYERKDYMLWGDAIYEGPNYCQYSGSTTIFYACAEFNHSNWPLFQHFIRLLTDPFIYIRYAKLDTQKEVLNSLASAMNSDHNRLQCKELDVNLGYKMRKFISWIKEHMHCEKFRVIGSVFSMSENELLDFFTTGANCTSEVDFRRFDLYKEVVAFVKDEFSREKRNPVVDQR